MTDLVLAKLKALHPALARYADEIAACEVCMNPKHDAHKPGVVWCGHHDPLAEVCDEARAPLHDQITQRDARIAELTDWSDRCAEASEQLCVQCASEYEANTMRGLQDA